MSFLGCALKPNKPEKLSVPTGELWHLSQVALHEPTKAGKNYVQVDVKGMTYTVACLEKDKVEHNSVDLFFGPEDATFVNKGPCEVHLLGYLEPKQDDDDELETVASPPKAGPTASAKASPKAGPKAEAKVAAKVDAKVEAKATAKAQAKAAPKQAEEEDDDEDEEEEEEGHVEESDEDKALPPKKKAGPAAKASPKAEPKAEAKASPKADLKRKAEQPPAASPESKKAKPEAKEAASPKAASAAASLEAEYVKSLVDYLKANGKVEVAKLGSAVKRPAGVSKMKTVFNSHADKFKIDGQHVELKK